MDCTALARSMDCATTHVSSVRSCNREKMEMAYFSAGEDKGGPHFKFWVKSCGFCLLLDYPALGLRNVSAIVLNLAN